MQREARMFDVEGEDELMEAEYEDEEAELSPVDEEQEVQELVEGYFHLDERESEHAVQREGGTHVMDRFGHGADPFELDAIDGDDDSAYEQAFMEVLSQEQSSRQDLKPSLDASSSMGYDGSLPNRELGGFAPSHGGDGATEGDVDMS